MIIDPNSICRLKDLNPVQQDVLKLIYKKVKNYPKDDQWRSVNEVIFYQGRRFRVELTYRLNDFFLEIQKREIVEEEESKIIKPRYINT